MLEKDGLDENWQEGAQSVWETHEVGGNDVEVHNRSLAVQRLMNPEEFVRYDSSGMGPGTDLAQDIDDDETDVSPLMHGGGLVYGHCETNEDGFRVVRDLDWSYFRERLIEHFHIMFTWNTIQWPRRNRCTNNSL